MDPKTLLTLEYDKVLALLARHASFSVSEEQARALLPTNDIEEARIRLAETSEARRLLDLHPATSIGGAHDIRAQAGAAARGVVLDPQALLDIKAILVSARELSRLFERSELQFPRLAAVAQQLPPPMGLIAAVTQVLSDRGEILDNASPRLAEIRRQRKVVHDRLLSRMQRMVADPGIAPYLQDALVTQRDGRYVIPLRADFKGKIRAVVHDQSASGATLFVEPLSVVDLNNQFRELQLSERDEERRILADLSQKVGEQENELVLTVETVGNLDLIFARAKFAEQLKAAEPRLKAFSKKGGSPHPGSTICLLQARHPLLDPETVVPIDVVLDPETYALVITGPNTGGKTVTLKTVGLLSLMAQAGMHIPVDSGSEISVFDNVFADIGDEQSIEQSLSTFSAHITNIARILKSAGEHSLVLLDELGSGTDPQEGAGLASAILSHLLDHRVTTLVASHFPEMKTYALSRPGVVNASVEFDIETLRPTYHLVIGLPGNSNALTIAERLGLPKDIVTNARSGIHPDELRAGDLLSEIHQQREITRKARVEAERIRSEAEELREGLALQLENIDRERVEILEKARQEAEDRLAELADELRELRRKLARARQPLEKLEEVEEKVNELEEEVSEPVDGESSAGIPGWQTAVPDLPIRLGDKVRLRGLGSQGVVSSISEDEAEVQIGVLRVRTRLDELQLARSPQDDSGEGPGPATGWRSGVSQAVTNVGRSSPGIELDLRGQRVDEALTALDRYLDAAYLAHLPWVRIIHGKGTGRLRKVVREALRADSRIASFEGGKHGEGGEGVTVAKFLE